MATSNSEYFIINGPNLNLLGIRETDIYGKINFDSYLEKLKLKYYNINLVYFQSNIEGELVNFIHKSIAKASGIVINPASYTHTSIAIGDAIASVNVPVIEVHISNIFSREDFRKHSHVSAKSVGVISGLGLLGYDLALEFLLQMSSNPTQSFP